MRTLSDDVTAAVLPSFLALLILSLVILSSCNRETAEGPTLSSDTSSDTASMGKSEWVVDPKDPGNNLPTVGRSLFDYLVTEQKDGKIMYKVPFPFPTLVKKIEQQLGAESSRSPLKRVLIPLNRSLQRHAAKPEFFKYPRAVLGVDTESPLQPGSSGMFLKDRLFLGYQEKANIIEVISYNEAAGRFEFQVVRDYRPGGTPKVLYANRAVCTVCHQNQSPIFARPLWDETNANPKIASLLQDQRRDFYQFPIHQGVDVPNALDDATDRANEFSASQLLWQDGCEQMGSGSESINCRADILRFLLRYRLGGNRGFNSRVPLDTDHFTLRFLKSWQEKWPQGLLIPDPDILNRNPLDFFRPSGNGMGWVQMISSEDGRERVALRSVFEPSVPRRPLATWSASQGLERVNRAIIGLSQFLAEPDIRRLDTALWGRALTSDRSARRYEAQCLYNPRYRRGSVERLTFRCARPGSTNGSDGGFEMEGTIYVNGANVEKGVIDHLSFSDGDDLADLTITHGKVTGIGARLKGRFEPAQRHSGLHARRTDGNAIKEIAFQMEKARPLPSLGTGTPAGSRSDDFPGSAIVMVLDDFSPVHHAIDVMAPETLTDASDAFGKKPFRRAVVMASLFEHLKMPRLKWCCVDDDGMPGAVADASASRADLNVSADGDSADAVPALKPFRRYCAKCHQSEDTFPPNFLHGSPQEVMAQVNHCAERIFFRLEMSRLSAPDRPETPMPPSNALRRLAITPEQWASHADLALLKNYASDILKGAGGRAPRLEDFVTQGYDNLRECLPASESSHSQETPD